MKRETERRFLQLAVALACLIPLAAGMVGVVQGPAIIEGDLTGDLPDLESHFRYLSGMLLGLGVGFVTSIPSIERRGELFMALSGFLQSRQSLTDTGQPFGRCVDCLSESRSLC